MYRLCNTWRGLPRTPPCACLCLVRRARGVVGFPESCGYCKALIFPELAPDNERIKRCVDPLRRLAVLVNMGGEADGLRAGDDDGLCHYTSPFSSNQKRTHDSSAGKTATTSVIPAR